MIAISFLFFIILSMDFSAKVRAARAAIQWSQEDLAKLANLSIQGIRDIENDKSSPTARTQHKILKAFEAHNYFFHEHGIEYREEKILTFYDFMDVLEDAEQTLRKGDDILFHCADEQRNTPEVTDKFNELRNKGINLRFTIEEGNKTITGSPKDYRWIDPEYFADREVRVIYADRYVIHIVEQNKDMFIVTKNEDAAETHRKEFEFFFKRGQRYAGE